MGFPISGYERKINLRLLGLFPILVLFSWLVSYLIATSSTFMILLAVLAVVLFAVIFFNPIFGLMLLFFVIPFEVIVPYPIFKFIALVFTISWLSRKAITREGIRFSFKYPQERYLVGLIFALPISIVFSIDKTVSLFEFHRFILLFAMCVFLIDSINSPKQLRNLGWVIGFSGGLASVVGLIQYYVFSTGMLEGTQSIGVAHTFGEESIRVAGFTGNPNSFALFLVVSICFLLYSFSTIRNIILRIFVIILIVGSTASIILTLSRSGLLALVTAILIYSIKLKGLKFTSVLLFIIIGLGAMYFVRVVPDFAYDRLVTKTFYERDTSRLNRVKAIKSGIQVLFENPHRFITGVGLNNFEKVSWDKRAPHNTYFLMLAEAGLFGFVFFILLIYYSYRDIWRGVKLKQGGLKLFCVASLSAFTAILVQGLTGDLNYFKHLWLFFALVPVIYNINRKAFDPR